MKWHPNEIFKYIFPNKYKFSNQFQIPSLTLQQISSFSLHIKEAANETNMVINSYYIERPIIQLYHTGLEKKKSLSVGIMD